MPLDSLIGKNVDNRNFFGYTGFANSMDTLKKQEWMPY